MREEIKMNLNRLVELKPIFDNQYGYIRLDEDTDLARDTNGNKCLVTHLAENTDHYVIETDDEQYINLPKPFYIAIWK